MRFNLTIVPVVLACLLLPACKGSKGDANDTTSRPINKANLTKCTCGTPEADIFGCTAPCSLGEPCDNPLCTCVPDSEKAKTQPAKVQKMDGTGYTGPGSAASDASPAPRPLFESSRQTSYRSYMTKDGKVIKGIPLRKEGDKVRLQMPIEGGGSVEELRPFDSFSAHSSYNILRQLEPGHDLKSHLALAKFALENGLIATTRRELREAKKYIKSESELEDITKRVKTGAAAILKDLTRKALAAGDLKLAYKYGSLLLTKLPDEVTEAEKTELLDTYDRLKAEKENAERAKREAAAQAKRSEQETRILKPLEERLSRASSRNHKGLMAGSSQSKALNNFKGASDDYMWVMKRTQQEQKKANNGSTILKGELANIETRAKSGYCDANLNAGSVYLSRGSINNARGRADAILAVDPENSRARSLRARAEIAGNRGWGYGGGWTVGGTVGGGVGGGMGRGR